MEEPLLWHYTSTPGLLGILQSRTLWATDCRYLNDSQELQVGLKQLGTVLRNWLEEEPAVRYSEQDLQAAKISRECLQSVHRSYLEQLLHLLEEPELLTAYVTCFCKDGDLLSQWRGYAAGGFALGFEPGELQNILPEATSETYDWKVALHIGLHAVNYFDPEHFRLLEALPESLKNLLTTTPRHNTPLAVDVDYRTRVLPALASNKHDSFKEEKEHRLIVIESRSFPYTLVRVRPGAYGLTPYLEIPFRAKALRQVRVGPGPNQKLSCLALQHHLMRDLAHVEVGLSRAPYRG